MKVTYYIHISLMFLIVPNISLVSGDWRNIGNMALAEFGIRLQKINYEIYYGTLFAFTVQTY